MDEIKGYCKGIEKLIKIDMLMFIFFKVEIILELKVVL